MIAKTLVTIGMLLVVSTLARAEPVTDRPLLNCAVISVAPNDPDFFTTAAGAPRAPQVGDRIALDLSGESIDDLQFESGRGIPLSRFETKLVRVTPAPAEFYDVFFVQKRGVLAYYEGTMIAQHTDDRSTVTLKAVKRAHQGAAVPFVLEMTCAH